MLGRNVVGQTCAVLLGLELYSGEGETLRLGLDHAHSLPVDEQQVVGCAVAELQRELPHRDSGACVQVDGGGVLHGPSRSLKQAVSPDRGCSSGVTLSILSLARHAPIDCPYHQVNGDGGFLGQVRVRVQAG